jgi:hypothetical protein
LVTVGRCWSWGSKLAQPPLTDGEAGPGSGRRSEHRVCSPPGLGRGALYAFGAAGVKRSAWAGRRASPPRPLVPWTAIVPRTRRRSAASARRRCRRAAPSRLVEGVGRHDRVAAQASRAAVADRAARAECLRGPGCGATVDQGRTERVERLTPPGALRVTSGLVGGDTCAAAGTEYASRLLPAPFRVVVSAAHRLTSRPPALIPMSSPRRAW